MKKHSLDITKFAGIDKDLLLARMASLIEELANSKSNSETYDCHMKAQELIKLVNQGSTFKKH